MKPLNVELTAEVIDAMAVTLVNAAKDLQQLASKMRANNDLMYASEAVQVVTNIMNALRLDLLVTRPLREMGRRENE